MTTELLEYARQLAEDQKHDQAYVLADKMLKESPESAEWLTLMSYLMLDTKKPIVAYSFAKNAVAANPRYASAWLNLGMACRDMRRDEEAIRYGKRGLKFAASDLQRSMFCVNIASSLIDRGEFDKARKYCEDSLKYNSDSEKAVMNLSFCQLATREWEEGWKNYRTVIGHDWRPYYDYGGELWDGKSKGHIVISGEQGIGDQISFASMLPDLIDWADKNGSKVTLDVTPKIAGVLQRSLPDIDVHSTLGANGNPWNEGTDYALPMAQLGEYFRTKDSDFPGKPYLKADPERVLQWKALFNSKNKPVIGVAWSGGIPETGSKFRRLTLDTLLPVFESVDAYWVSLQYKPAKREIEKFEAEHGIHIAEYPHATLTDDYDDTVAMVAALDAVVAMHTSVCHVAGGLGVPCLTLVPKNSQWRYGASGEDFVWANSLKLIRQENRNDWTSALERTAEELNALFGSVPKATAEPSRKGKLRGNRPKVRSTRKRHRRQTGS
ncbi:MAG: tetratricopeptide repeat protein [Cyanobacteria bacterium P01_G01_bin.4]